MPFFERFNLAAAGDGVNPLTDPFSLFAIARNLGCAVGVTVAGIGAAFFTELTSCDRSIGRSAPTGVPAAARPGPRFPAAIFSTLDLNLAKSILVADSVIHWILVCGDAADISSPTKSSSAVAASPLRSSGRIPRFHASLANAAARVRSYLSSSSSSSTCNLYASSAAAFARELVSCWLFIAAANSSRTLSASAAVSSAMDCAALARSH